MVVSGVTARLPRYPPAGTDWRILYHHSCIVTHMPSFVCHHSHIITPLRSLLHHPFVVEKNMTIAPVSGVVAHNKNALQGLNLGAYVV